MNAFATILLLVSAFGQLNARDPALPDDCLNGDRSAKDCCTLVPRAFYAHLKHPNNCGQFYHCAHGAPVLKDCPAGLHWSVKMDRCEWPSIAKCKGTATTTTTTPKPTTTSTAATEGTTTDNPGTSTCWTATISNDCRYGKESADKCCVGVSSWEDALLPNPDNCGTYIQCVHEKPMVRDCPAGLHWSPDACRCEWPSIAKCNGTATTTTTTPKPTTTTTTPRPTTTSTTPRPTTTSTTVSTTTAGTTTDNPEKSTCWTATISNDCRYGKESADKCCVGVSPLEDALLPNPDNCGTYIQCVHEKPMVRNCPAGLHWSPDACRCEWPSIAKCNGTTSTTTRKPTTTTTTPRPTTTSTTPRPTTTSTTVSTTTAGTTTDNPGKSTCWTATISNDCRYGKESADKCCVGVSPLEDALLPNPDNCGTYIQCVHEKPMVRDCPVGLQWSPDACRCEWPSIAKCNGTATTTTTTPKPTTTTTTTRPTTTSTTPRPTTTSTTVSTTTVGTTTDNPGKSTCWTATISNDCRYGKESADKCCVGVSPLEDALLPNPDSCGTYIQCVHEKPMVRDCPAGLHWSPDACRCEWPSIAKCNGTTSTTTTTPRPTTTTTTPRPTTTSTTVSTTTSGTTTDNSGTSTCSTATISNDCRYGKESADECCVGVSPWEDVLLPNPDSCGTYLQCVHEKPMVRDCPDGLHWSPDACRCEWPSIAKCT